MKYEDIVEIEALAGAVYDCLLKVEALEGLNQPTDEVERRKAAVALDR